jgi:hypothetical protein
VDADCRPGRARVRCVASARTSHEKGEIDPVVNRPLANRLVRRIRDAENDVFSDLGVDVDEFYLRLERKPALIAFSARRTPAAAAPSRGVAQGRRVRSIAQRVPRAQNMHMIRMTFLSQAQELLRRLRASFSLLCRST